VIPSACTTIGSAVVRLAVANRPAHTISRPAHTMVQIRPSRRRSASDRVRRDTRSYTSVTVADASAPSDDDSAAARMPAITNPDRPDGSSVTMKFANSSSLFPRPRPPSPVGSVGTAAL
jgi:hypothetical protein